MVIVCNFCNFVPSKSGGVTALPAPIVVMPLVSFPIYLFCCTTFPCAFSFILSSPMILLLLQCLLHPPCPSFHSPSSSSSSISFCAWAYFESGPILWYYTLNSLSFPPSSLFPLLPSHSFPPSLLLPSLPSSSLPPFLPLLSSLPSPLALSLLPPSPLG